MEEKKEAKNCWEYWNCPEEVRRECPAYIKKEGRRCWIYTRDFKSSKCPRARDNYKYCSECLWYQKMHQEDNIEDAS